MKWFKKFKSPLPKIILVHYVNVRSIDVNDIENYMANITTSLRVDNPYLLQFFIPVVSKESYTECVYPKNRF
jgi:hypothetical protein